MLLCRRSISYMHSACNRADYLSPYGTDLPTPAGGVVDPLLVVERVLDNVNIEFVIRLKMSCEVGPTPVTRQGSTWALPLPCYVTVLKSPITTR